MNLFPKSRQQSLNWLTLVLVLSILLPLLILWGIETYSELELSRERSKSTNSTTAQFVARLVDKSLNETLTFLRSHVDDLAIKLQDQDTKEVNLELEEMLFSNPLISGIALYEPEGKGIAHLLLPGRMNHDSIYCPKASDMDWSKESWFQEYDKGARRPMISNVFEPPCEPGTPNGAAVIPVEKDGRTLGVLRASFDAESIDAWFKSLRLPPGVQITLIDGNQMILYDSKIERKMTLVGLEKNQKELAAQLYFKQISAGQSWVAIYANTQTSQNEIVAYSPIKGYKWSALVRQPQNIADAPVKKHILQFSTIMIAVFLFGLTLVGSARRSYSRQQDLSQELGEALEKERFFEERLSDSIKDLAIINVISSEISRGLDIDTLLARITEHAARLVKADFSACFIWEGEKHPQHAVVRNLPEECVEEAKTKTGLGNRILETGQPLIVDDYPALPERLECYVKAGAKTAIVVPILTDRKPIGTLTAGSFSETPRKYTEYDLELLQSVARQAGIALQNANLYATSQNVANTLQETLLTLPEKLDGIDFSHAYHSATKDAKVGGDFYDLFELKNNRIGMVIGDISGKGLEAATLTARVKNTIRAYAYQWTSPAKVMQLTNDTVIRTSAPSMFATVFFGILDKKSGTLTYCSAGHPQAAIKHPTSSKIALLKTGSTIIGMFDDSHYGDNRKTLKQGDTLILYTDGVLEARRRKELFGWEGLEAVIKSSDKSDIRELPTQILDELLRFTDETLSDDVAVLAITYDGKPRRG